MLNYDYVDPTAFGGVAAGALIFIVIIVSILSLAVSIITIIAMWKMFVKAGEEGWKAIIPVYNMMILCRITGINSWWPVILVVCSLLSPIPIVGWILSIALTIGTIYFAIILAVSTARAYGQSDGYAVGYILLSVVFYAITGFGKAQYVGNSNPMNDPVGIKINEFLVSHNFPSGFTSK